MFGTSTPASSGTSGHNGHITSENGHTERRTRRAGLWRRGRSDAGAWICVGCGLAVNDAVAAGLGFCPRCQDFTGLCGAGRTLLSPDVMGRSSWHTPCTSRGVAAWQVGSGDSARVLLLCQVHDDQVRAGKEAWIGQAVPLPQ
jgi:hypothetical protein